MADKARTQSLTQSLMQELLKKNPDLKRLKEQARGLGLPEDASVETLMAYVLQIKVPVKKKPEAQA